MEVEFTFWYLYWFFLLLAEIARLQISVFYASVIGQANVTICDFFGFGYLDGLGSRGRGRQTIILIWPPGMLGRLEKVCLRALLT